MFPSDLNCLWDMVFFSTCRVLVFSSGRDYKDVATKPAQSCVYIFTNWTQTTSTGHCGIFSFLG